MPPTSEPTPSSSSASSNGMWRQAMRFSYVGIFFGVAVVIGWLAGRWCEKKWGGAPWLSLVGVLFGVAAGFRELYRIAKSVSRGTRD